MTSSEEENVNIEFIYVGENPREFSLPPLSPTEGFYVLSPLFRFDCIDGIFKVMHPHSKIFARGLVDTINSIILPREYLEVVLKKRNDDRKKDKERREKERASAPVGASMRWKSEEDLAAMYAKDDKALEDLFDAESSIGEFQFPLIFEGVRTARYKNGTILCEYQYGS